MVVVAVAVGVVVVVAVAVAVADGVVVGLNIKDQGSGRIASLTDEMGGTRKPAFPGEGARDA